MFLRGFLILAFIFSSSAVFSWGGGFSFQQTSNRVFSTEKVTGRHGKAVEVKTYHSPQKSTANNRSAGPWVMKNRKAENKIVAHCGSDRCKACIIIFKQFACFAAVRGGGWSSRDGSGVFETGKRSDGSSCSYKDTPDSRNASLKKAALPKGFRARSTRVFYQSGKYNAGTVGDFPPMTLHYGRKILIHSRRLPFPGESNQVPRYGIPANATLSDIESTSNSYGCPIVSGDCMGKLYSHAKNLPFEVKEVAGELNYNDFK